VNFIKITLLLSLLALASCRDYPEVLKFHYNDSESGQVRSAIHSKSSLKFEKILNKEFLKARTAMPLLT